MAKKAIRGKPMYEVHSAERDFRSDCSRDAARVAVRCIKAGTLPNVLVIVPIGDMLSVRRVTDWSTNLSRMRSMIVGKARE